MKIIVGLGNPGEQYASTRHNVGFLVIEELAKRLDVRMRKSLFKKAEVGHATLGGKKITLVKPLTFMNESGRAVRSVAGRNTKPEEVLVVYDEADLSFGDRRHRTEGSSGGHNGMQSVIDALGTTGVPRLRMGIGRPARKEMPLDVWVLSRWSEEEKPQVQHMVEEAASAILEMLA